MIIKTLKNNNLISCPDFILHDTQYLVKMGSNEFGTFAALNSSRDNDYYGFCFPKEDDIFPQKLGYLEGYDNKLEPFQSYTCDHILYENVSHDLNIYNITKYFQLAKSNNPMIIDSLFVSDKNIEIKSAIAKYVLENKKIFISKKIIDTYLGFARKQMKLMKDKKDFINQTKPEDVAKIGYVTKPAYHAYRLMTNCIQLLETGNLSLNKHSNIMLSIRNHEWQIDALKKYLLDLEEKMRKLELTSELPKNNNPDNIKNLLINCLEMHYGNLENYGYFIKLNFGHKY